MKKADKKLSVCIITYNQVQFIGPAIESVLSQSLPLETEIIIADDCSTDGTRDIIIDYSKRYESIIPILQEKNLGPAANFKALIQSAVGEYVAYLDGDDLMLPGKIESQVKYLDENPDCAIVAHNMKIYYEDRRLLSGTYSNLPTGKYDIGTLARLGTFFCNSSKMYKNICNQDYAFYEEYICVGDYVWHMYQVKNARIGYLEHPYGIYRKHRRGASASNMDKARLKLAFKENLKALDFSSIYVSDARDVRLGKRREMYAYALRCFGAQEFGEYKSHVKESKRFGGFYSVRHCVMYYLSFLPSQILRILSKIL